jgi:hypothetical protein
MITTWLIITCQGMSDQVRNVIIDTALVTHNPHFYERTPWLEEDTNSDGPMPTIQIYCDSQKDALRLRKKLREVCVPYAERFPRSRNSSKEWILNPLDGRAHFRYTDEDGNDLESAQMPARASG